MNLAIHFRNETAAEVVGRFLSTILEKDIVLTGLDEADVIISDDGRALLHHLNQGKHAIQFIVSSGGTVNTGASPYMGIATAPNIKERFHIFADSDTHWRGHFPGVIEMADLLIRLSQTSTASGTQGQEGS